MKFSESLKKNSYFQNIYKNGTSLANRYFVMYVLENNLEKNRLGISVSKKDTLFQGCPFYAWNVWVESPKPGKQLSALLPVYTITFKIGTCGTFGTKFKFFS